MNTNQCFNRFLLVTLAAALTACASPGASSVTSFLSVQDGRARLVNGAGVVANDVDTLAVIELVAGKLVLRHELQMPTSLVGPPSSVAVAPNRQLALVSAATRRDPADAKKVISSDLVSVVTLDAVGNAAPRVVASLHTGAGASGISINRAGTLALVANRGEGSISVLGIEGQKVEVLSKIPLGDKSSPSHVAITPDGRRALVTREGENRITVLDIVGTTVTVSKRDMYAGIRPYGLGISPGGDYAVVGNLGGGFGDSDTISLIDLKLNPPRVIDTVTVGQTPEGIDFSPDGALVGITLSNGSNKPAASPFYGPGLYVLFRVEGGRLVRVADLKGGQWLQGHAFSSDGRNVLVQDAMNREILLYKLQGNTLSDTGERLKFNAAPSAIRTWK